MGGKNSGRVSAYDFEPDKDAEPWEKQVKETGKAWLGFKTYRDLGPKRTMAKVAVQLGKKPNYLSTLEQWSVRWGWRLRSNAWDTHQDRAERDAVLAEAEKKAKQKLGFAEGMWMTAARGLGMWNTYIAHALKRQKDQIQEVAAVEHANSLTEDPALRQPVPDVDEPPMSIGDMQRLADTGLKLAQLLEGKPTDIQEQRQQITIDERRKGIQQLIHNPKLRAAMKQVAEAMEGKADDSTGVVH